MLFLVGLFGFARVWGLGSYRVKRIKVESVNEYI